MSQGLHSSATLAGAMEELDARSRLEQVTAKRKFVEEQIKVPRFEMITCPRRLRHYNIQHVAKKSVTCNVELRPVAKAADTCNDVVCRGQRF